MAEAWRGTSTLMRLVICTWIMEMVKQRRNDDCGVACMAMILGISYVDAEECYDYTIGCAHTASMEKLLNKHGFALYVRNQDRDADAIAYLLNCRSPAGSHWVVMTTEGEFYDPSPTPLQEYQGVNFYKIKPKCTNDVAHNAQANRF